MLHLNYYYDYYYDIIISLFDFLSRLINSVGASLLTIPSVRMLEITPRCRSPTMILDVLY